MDKAKIYHDRKSVKPTYKINDLVLVRETKTEIKKSKKLTFRWRGPYKIIDIINNIDYKLKSIPQSTNDNRKHRARIILRHFNDLKKYKGTIPQNYGQITASINESPSTNDNTNNVSDLDTLFQTSQNGKNDTQNSVLNLPDEIQDEDSMPMDHDISPTHEEIERILNHKAVKNSFHFYVQYKNRNIENEWVAKSCITDQNLIEAYRLTLPNGQLKQEKPQKPIASPLRQSTRLKNKTVASERHH